MQRGGLITLRREFEAQKCALIVIDAQEAFLGEQATIPVRRKKKVIENIKQLVLLARNAGLPLIWTRVVLDNWVQGCYRELWPEHFNGTEVYVLQETASDSQIVRPLRSLVLPDDLILVKNRYSAFRDTALAEYLRDRGILNLVFAGVSTNVCVESSIRDAFQLDFRPILVRDATSSFSAEMQRVSEQVISMVFGYVVPLQDLQTLLS